MYQDKHASIQVVNVKVKGVYYTHKTRHTTTHMCILGGDTGHTHTHTHTHTHAEEVASEICPLLLTHPELSFLEGSQEQWAAFNGARGPSQVIMSSLGIR